MDTKQTRDIHDGCKYFGTFVPRDKTEWPWRFLPNPDVGPISKSDHPPSYWTELIGEWEKVENLPRWYELVCVSQIIKLSLKTDCINYEQSLI